LSIGVVAMSGIWRMAIDYSLKDEVFMVRMKGGPLDKCVLAAGLEYLIWSNPIKSTARLDTALTLGSRA